ncbi:unnamed protein product, partial [marine sediment metagenome]
GIVEDVGAAVSSAYDVAKDWVSGAATTVGETLSDAYEFTFDTSGAWVTEAAETVDEAKDTVIEETDKVIDEVIETVGKTKETVTTFIDDRLGDISVNIDFGFDWLAARLEDLLAIPATAFFGFISSNTPGGNGITVHLPLIFLHFLALTQKEIQQPYSL